MNCANHPDRERAAFCQNCGKPLCTECVRNVGTSVFCEPCLTARVAGNAPPTGYGYTSVPPSVGPIAPGEPNPSIAALLGFIPGVGAMYNEQYAKGIVHLIVFALLVSLASDVNGIFGLFVAGWIAYMVIEAHHTARARRDGTPLPNPFGLNELSERLGFGKAWPGPGPAGPPYTPPAPGAVNPNVPPAGSYAPPYNYTYVPPVSQWGVPHNTAAYSAPPMAQVPPVPPYPDPDSSYFHRFPSGAIWLIGLGLLFLIGDTGIFHVFHIHNYGPLLLIGFGVWLFVRSMTSTGQGLENDGSALYHWRLTRAINCSFWVILTGVIWLLDVLHILSWGRSWPIYLIALGLLGVFKRAAYPGPATVPPPSTYSPPAPVTPVAPATSTELMRTDGGSQPSSNDQEGR